ncbi:SMODS domain-containing nucleotidyltransferase [Nocardia cyriacigeorgica]|uniref:SMODS domain-containing nucleotidyltransferase n=1 Tax=Nocardia cyriacigeorgica TaxID=135487 RepID=UPI0024537A9C|nr:nucleotidyltransferase [Nocardia cyriacigeorgica]
MDIQPYFDTFLKQISLGQKQRDRIESASNALIDFLSDQYELSSGDVFLQGSYVNGTAVKPIEGGEYDVDIVCVCATADQSAEAAIGGMFDTLDSHGRYSRKLTPKQPCVRIDYADDEIGKFHVDVVPTRRPSRTDSQAPLDAPRKSSGWHATAPEEYTAWCTQQGPHFQQVVQMLKRWRDEHQTVRGAIKSIVLQVLIFEHLPASAVDDAERLAHTVRGLHEALASLDEPPVVTNPVLDSENLAARWSAASFKEFKRELAEAAQLVSAATGTNDLVEAVETWRDLLGDDFPAVPKDVFPVQLADASHAKGPASRGWVERLDSRYQVSIRAWSRRGRRGRRIGYPNDGRLLFPGCFIEFKADRSGPTDTSVWWRVTNTGDHARVERSLRGDFIQAKRIDDKPSPDPELHCERTAYTESPR